MFSIWFLLQTNAVSKSSVISLRGRIGRETQRQWKTITQRLWAHQVDHVGLRGVWCWFPLRPWAVSGSSWLPTFLIIIFIYLVVPSLCANTLILWPSDVTSQLPIDQDPDAGKDWGQEEKGVTEEEMVGWYHQLNGREFTQTLGDSEGHGTLQSMGSQRVRTMTTAAKS